MELTDLLVHDGKVTLDKKVILSLSKGIRVEIEIIAAILYWYLKQQVNGFCEIDTGKKGDTRGYRAPKENWHQLRIWFQGDFKGFRMQVDILTVVFDCIYKQQLKI